MLTTREAVRPDLSSSICLPTSRFRGDRLIVACSFSVYLLAIPAFGAEWRWTKGVSASATFSDNVDGAVSDDPTRVETVLGLSPFVTLSGIGRRHELTFDGRFELTRFVDEGRTTLDPDASVRTRSILIDRFAELETIARVSQRSADGNPLTDDELRLDGDREETWELGVSPSVETTLGTRSLVLGEYRFATIRSSDDERVGSDTHALASRLDTVLTANGVFAFVVAEGAAIRFENGDSGRAASLGAGAGRPIGRTLQGAVSAGRDWVRVDRASETLEDTFWTVALRWEPNERATAIVGYGERVFGRRPSASLRLSGRRSSVEFRWSRELSLSSGIGRVGDTFSAPSDEVDTSASLAEREESLVEDEENLSPFAENASRVRERIDIGYSLDGRRSQLTASIGWFDDEQLEGSGNDPISASSDSRGNELTLGFTRTLSSRVDASSRYRFLTTREDGTSGSVRSNLVEFVVSVRL